MLSCVFVLISCLIYLIASSPIQPQTDITPECTTVSGGPQEGVPCILPFRFKGKVRNECILEKGEDKPWCSTKVNERGAHLGGQKQWGYCDPQCPVAPKDTNSECTTVSGGPQEGVPCIIPFKFKGKVRNGCILEEGEDKPWCSTKVNEEGAHLGGQKQWGYCDPQCPVAPKETKVNANDNDNQHLGDNPKKGIADDYAFRQDEYDYGPVAPSKLIEGEGEGEYTEDYDDYYDEDNLPDLSSSSDINRVAGANEADSSSGTSGVSSIKDTRRRCKPRCLDWKYVRKDGVLGKLVWKCVKKGCRGRRGKTRRRD